MDVFRSTCLVRLLRSIARSTYYSSRLTRPVAPVRLSFSPQRSQYPSRAFHTQYRRFNRPEYSRERYPRYGPRHQQDEQQLEQHQRKLQNEYQEQSQHQAQQHQDQQHSKPSSLAASLSLKRIALFACPAAVIFYFMNLETVPVSGRRRFNCFSPASAEAQGEVAYKEVLQQEQARGKLLPAWDPRTKMVERVMTRLIEGGKLGTGTVGEQAGWEINVIDDPNVINAFVLPGGKVFVYTGILPICRNDAGLAAVLGHEAAHNICQHAAERMSSFVYLQPLIWSLMYFDFLVFGTPVGLSHLVGGLLLDLVISKPGSRQQESEADHVGLMLMAQACYDPKEAPLFWERMEKASMTPPEWLSTHPSNDHRIEAINRLIPKAEEESLKSGCGYTSSFSDPFKEAVERIFGRGFNLR